MWTERHDTWRRALLAILLHAVAAATFTLLAWSPLSWLVVLATPTVLAPLCATLLVRTLVDLRRGTSHAAPPRRQALTIAFASGSLWTFLGPHLQLTHAEHELTQLAPRLAAYREDHDTCPRTLADLGGEPPLTSRFGPLLADDWGYGVWHCPVRAEAPCEIFCVHAPFPWGSCGWNGERWACGHS